MSETIDIDTPPKKPRKPRRARRVPPPKREFNYIKRQHTAIALRPEHYFMLRELADYYETPLMRLAGALIVREYCRVLAQTDPEGAAALRQTYADDEQHREYVTQLPE
jgi:hypothetical protein